MKTNYINPFFRVYDFGADYGGVVADPQDPGYYDQTTDPTLGVTNDPSWDYGFSGQPSQPANSSSGSGSSVSPWIGSIHSLVQDATSILLATKGVSQQQPTVIAGGSSLPIYNASQSALYNKNGIATPYQNPQSKNTATYIALGVLALLVVLAIVFFMRSKK